VDGHRLFVGDVEFLQPPCKALPSTVAVELTPFVVRVLPLSIQPLVREERDVAHVALPVVSCSGGPLWIGSPFLGSLVVLQELHGGERAGGVPGGRLLGVPVLLHRQLAPRDWLVLSPRACALAKHPPLSGSSLAEVELASPGNHLGLSVAFVQVDVVLPTVFYFLDVDVGSQPEDVEVPGRYGSHHVGCEVEAALWSPLLPERWL